jgi:hypothetical protein
MIPELDGVESAHSPFSSQVHEEARDVTPERCRGTMGGTLEVLPSTEKWKRILIVKNHPSTCEKAVPPSTSLAVVPLNDALTTAVGTDGDTVSVHEVILQRPADEWKTFHRRISAARNEPGSIVSPLPRPGCKGRRRQTRYAPIAPEEETRNTKQ